MIQRGKKWEKGRRKKPRFLVQESLLIMTAIVQAVIIYIQIAGRIKNKGYLLTELVPVRILFMEIHL